MTDHTSVSRRNAAHATRYLANRPDSGVRAFTWKAACHRRLLLANAIDCWPSEDAQIAPFAAAGGFWTEAPTCHDSGILFDKKRSALFGSVVGTAAPRYRRPTGYGKTWKRRANTPSAPVGCLGERTGQSLETKQGTAKQEFPKQAL